VILADELRQTFLFAHLSETQVQEMVAAGSEVRVEAGDTLWQEGAPADSLWVLLDGELEFTQHAPGQKVTLFTIDRKGLWVGGFRAFGEGPGSTYRATARALRPSRLFQLPSPELGRLLSTWFPLGKHLLDGLMQTLASVDALMRERESLVALGTMAAGMAHELNNPAATAARARTEIGSTLGAMRDGIAALTGSGLSPDQFQTVFALQERVLEMARDNAPLDPLAVSDREDEITDWLQDQGLDDGWKLAPTLVAEGLDLDWLERTAQMVGPVALAPTLQWITSSLAVTSLLDQLGEATTRISDLVRAVKEYVYMDSAPVQEIDLRQGLDNALVMLGYKLKQGVEVVREYDPALPHIEAYGSQLNQVWLNLLDNAIDAMGGSGTIRIRTAQDGDGALIEIADSGPGVPEDIRRRIFDPFFTTKEPGKGTGLGLDIARRIVVERHGGDLSVESVPGDTRFSVRLSRRLTNRES
jgi:signal transduction histidine kinase